MTHKEKLTRKILLVLVIVWLLGAYWLYSGKILTTFDWLISFGRLVGA